MTPILLGLGLATFAVLLGRWLMHEHNKIERGDYDHR